MTRGRRLLGAVLVLFMFLTLGSAAAQEPESSEEAEPAAEAQSSAEAESAPETSAGTSFEATVDFSMLNQTSLDGTAGEIEILSVEFEVAGAKGGGIKGAFSSADADMNAIITTRIGCATKAATKWKIDMMVEFLDSDGKVIDRVTNSETLKNNDKTFNFNHTTLRWAVDHITKARITVKAKQ